MQLSVDDDDERRRDVSIVWGRTAGGRIGAWLDDGPSSTDAALPADRPTDCCSTAVRRPSSCPVERRSSGSPVQQYRAFDGGAVPWSERLIGSGVDGDVLRMNYDNIAEATRNLLRLLNYPRNTRSAIEPAPLRPPHSDTSRRTSSSSSTDSCTVSSPTV